MSYSTVVNMQLSSSLRSRCAAAAANEVTAGNAPGDTNTVVGWVNDRSWDFATTPGWDTKWESGVAAGVADPGENGAVITDADILSRVQQLLTEHPLPTSV